MRILHWFRKDLRLDDNTALSEACRDADGGVIPFYASEPSLLARPDIAPARVRFVLESLACLDADVRGRGSSLALAHGDAVRTVPAAAREANADAVYWNDEYEPSLRARDDAVERALRAAGVGVKRFHDRLLVPAGAAHKRDGTPYTVYTPFRRACEALPVSAPLPVPASLAPHPLPTPPIATLGQLGIAEPVSASWPGGARAAAARLARFIDGDGEGEQSSGLGAYVRRRDEPAVRAGSGLSADLKFGTIGIRRLLATVRAAAGPRRREAAQQYESQLRWRDFYAHVLWHFPHVETGCFRAAYDAIRWEGTDEHFTSWCQGRTGYPVVDAGMRELLATGFMHNRVRMIVASFLTKDLLLDWRRGERHFMRHLVDGDLANNNGGWQWSAGTGTDAAPYFRIFNPVTQGRRFDNAGAYVRRWCPELARVSDAFVHRPWEAPSAALAEAGVSLGGTWPLPIVDHAAQRERALAMYRQARVPAA